MAQATKPTGVYKEPAEDSAIERKRQFGDVADGDDGAPVLIKARSMPILIVANKS